MPAVDDEDDLDVLIEPSKPVSLDVEIMPLPDGPPRRRREPAGDRIDREPAGHERGERERGDRDSGGRERGERPGRPRRDGDGGRERRPRRGDSGPSEPRTPRIVKQLYPPAGMEEAPPPEGAPKALPFASRRTPRGPMMREAGAEPPPKGKVRQLYPPPQFDEEYVEENGAPAPPAAIGDPERAPLESMFVSGAEELDERRRQARERAETRRGEEAAPGAIRPPFGGPFADDEDED